MKIDTPILRRLGPIPFWRGRDKCLQALDEMYQSAGDYAKKLLANLPH